MKKNIETFARVNKNLPLQLGAGLTAAFILGYAYRPVPDNYEQSSIVPVVKVETLFIKNNVPAIVKKPILIYEERGYGYGIRKMGADQLRKDMELKGFRNLKDMDLIKLRRVWLGFNYESLFYHVHEITDFPVSMIYSFFIIEATNQGIETDLFRIHANAGGGKALKGQKSVTYRTREVIMGKNKFINAKFFSANNTKEGIELWAGILNSGRYAECKLANWKLPKEKLYKSICKCIYQNGYHTDIDYSFRASLMGEFWEIKKHFPKALKDESHLNEF